MKVIISKTEVENKVNLVSKINHKIIKNHHNNNKNKMLKIRIWVV